MAILPKTNYYDQDLALAIVTKNLNEAKRANGTIKKEDEEYEKKLIEDFESKYDGKLDIDKFYKGAEAGHFIKYPMKFYGNLIKSLNCKFDNLFELFKDFYKKTCFIGQSIMLGSIAGLVISIPMLLKGKISAIKNLPILGALAGGVGSGLFVKDKKTEDVEKTSKLLKFDSLGKISKNTICGGITGLTSALILMISNGIKNKTFNIFKNMGQTSKVLSSVGAGLGLLYGVFNIMKSNHIKQNLYKKIQVESIPDVE